MPITRRQFELGIDKEVEGWIRQVYGQLEKNKDLAYSHQELLEGLRGGPPEPEKFERALYALLALSAVAKSEVDGTDYYAFNRELDFKSWELKPQKARVRRW